LPYAQAFLAAHSGRVPLSGTDPIEYKILHLLNTEAFYRVGRHSTKLFNDYPFFDLGSGYCYLCFPPAGYVPTDCGEYPTLWRWGDGLLAVGCTQPELISNDLTYDPAAYSRLLSPQPINLWANDQVRFYDEQRFMHVAICSTVTEYRQQHRVNSRRRIPN
jgi:hypothetical protein